LLKAQNSQHLHKSNDLMKKIEDLNGLLIQKENQRESERRKNEFDRREKDDYISKIQMEFNNM